MHGIYNASYEYEYEDQKGLRSMSFPRSWVKDEVIRRCIEEETNPIYVADGKLKSVKLLHLTDPDGNTLFGSEDAVVAHYEQ